MKNWTILRAYFLIYIACCLIFTIVNWKTLSYEEGWGVVYMLGLISIGIVGLFADFILRLIIKKQSIIKRN